MERKSKIEIKETFDELKKIYQSTNNSRVKLKIKSLLLFKEQKMGSQEKIAEHLCISHATFKRWLKEYNKNGLSFLLSVKDKGKPKSVIDEEIKQALNIRLIESSYPFKSYSDVKNWITVEYGVDVKYATIRNYMIKQFKTRIKRTKTSNFVTRGKAV